MSKKWSEIRASRPDTPERSAAYERAMEELADLELPGLWETADFIGGETDAYGT